MYVTCKQQHTPLPWGNIFAHNRRVLVGNKRFPLVLFIPSLCPLLFIERILVILAAVVDLLIITLRVKEPLTSGEV